MTQLGEQLRDLREGYGFEVEDTARLANLTPARVRDIESGAPVSTAELAELADALAIDPAVLHARKADDVQRTLARFRAPVGITQLGPSDRRMLARAADVGRVCAELQRLLDRPSPIADCRELLAVASYPEPWVQGYGLAFAARRRLAPTPSPLGSVQETFEGLGIHVAYVSFQSEEVEAASLFEPGSAPVILLNQSSPRVSYPLSRRAILAHELCHILHDGGERHVTVVSTDEGADPSLIEKRANAFAPSFLAPGEWVSVTKSDPRDLVVELAETWGLSFEGASWHAKNLKLITEACADSFSRMKWRPSVDADCEQDLPRTPPDYLGIEATATSLTNGLLAELTIIASADGLVSKGRAQEILSLQ